jgi:cell division septum initiation protein DivIVA
MNVMRENIKLITEISILRKEVKTLDNKLKNHTSKNKSSSSNPSQTDSKMEN